MVDKSYPRLGKHAPDRPCQFCRTEIPHRAAKCAACGEWVPVNCEYSPPARALRTVGVIWIALSILAALVVTLFGLSDGATPLFFWAAGLLLQGLFVGCLAIVVAELPPRRPL